MTESEISNVNLWVINANCMIAKITNIWRVYFHDKLFWICMKQKIIWVCLDWRWEIWSQYWMKGECNFARPRTELPRFDVSESFLIWVLICCPGSFECPTRSKSVLKGLEIRLKLNRFRLWISMNIVKSIIVIRF